MRTQEEIAAKVKASRKHMLDFTGEALLHYLDFEHARPFLKLEATAEEWEKVQKPVSQDVVLRELRSYMEFAWTKVEDHRGISASRSVDKCSAWAWLLGSDAICAAVEAAGYAQYGAPKLAVICRAFDLPIPVSSEVTRMIDGQSCVPDCDNGCAEE